MIGWESLWEAVWLRITSISNKLRRYHICVKPFIRVHHCFHTDPNYDNNRINVRLLSKLHNISEYCMCEDEASYYHLTTTVPTNNNHKQWPCLLRRYYNLKTLIGTVQINDLIPCANKRAMMALCVSPEGAREGLTGWSTGGAYACNSKNLIILIVKH